MTVRLSSLLRTLGLTVACVLLASCAPSNLKITHEQETLLIEARHLWLCMFSYANDYCGLYPESLKELLAEYWQLDESLIYANPEEPRKSRFQKWNFLNAGRRMGTTSDPDEVLFSSSNGPEGVVVAVFTDGRFFLMNKAGIALQSGHVADIHDRGPIKQNDFPRLVVIIENERLSYYKNWQANEVIEQVKSFAAPIIKANDKPFSMVRFRSGAMTSPDATKSHPEIYLKHDLKVGWHFMEWRADRPNTKMGTYHRHNNRTFATPEKAVEWYIEEYLKPLL